MNNRLLIGGIVGAGLMYLLDTEMGSARRERMLGIWNANQDAVDGARQFAGQAAGAVRPLAGRFGLDWEEPPSPGLMARAALPALLAAGAAGFGLAYLFDAERGAERRAKVQSFVNDRRQGAQQAVGQTVSQIRPHVESFGPRLDSIRSKAQDTALSAVRRGNGSSTELESAAGPTPAPTPRAAAPANAGKKAAAASARPASNE